MATDLYAALEHAIPAVRGEFETLWRDLVQIPTVSMDPAHAEDIQRGAHQAAALLQACGATAEIVETPGNPVVFGQLIVNPAYPTVAIYNHLDAQPANEPQWRQAPFVFHRDGERYLGRGTTDEKERWVSCQWIMPQHAQSVHVCSSLMITPSCVRGWPR